MAGSVAGDVAESGAETAASRGWDRTISDSGSDTNLAAVGNDGWPLIF